VINRSPKYKNRYVHRRTSQSLADLTPQQIEERRRLGLVRFSIAMEDMSRLLKVRPSNNNNQNNDEDQLADFEEDEDDESESLAETHRPGFL
jgi:hypothetical protein